MKKLGKFAFPYFGDFFLLLKFAGLLGSISFWYLIPLYLVDYWMWKIILKQVKMFFNIPFPFFTIIFFILNITATITQPYWWIIWFFLTDLTNLGAKAFNAANKEIEDKNC